MRERETRAARFFVDAPLAEGARFALPAPAAHHAARVLRLAPGDALTLFDGRGGEYPASITAIGRRSVEVALGAKRALEIEAPLAITLVQGLSSGEHMDSTIQKSVELGAAAIQPVATERSIVRLSPARIQAKVEHWQRVVIAACEQCGRNRIPRVLPVLALPEYCRAARSGALRLLLSPRGVRRLSEAAAAAHGAIDLAAGPEGGFSEAEEALLRAAGFAPVRLGPRVLRTETAAPAALAALNALAGDF